MNILLVGYRKEIVEQHKKIISASFGDCTIATCRPGLEVLETAEHFAPHLLIILSSSDHFDCLDLVDHLLGSRPQIYILFIAEKGERLLLERALAAGVDDFIAGLPTADELILRVKRGLSDVAQSGRRSGFMEPPAAREKREPGRGLPAAAIRIAGNAVFAVLLLFMTAAVLFLVQSKVSGEAPSLFGYRVYTVLSGSMSPAFDTGSVVFVRPADPQGIAAGDVITFTGGGDQLTTHRVVEIDDAEGIEFTTRGDANNVNDPNPVPAERLVGRVHGSAPYLGYIIEYLRTRTGLIILVFIPAFLVILFELRNIYLHLREGDRLVKTTCKAIPPS